MPRNALILLAVAACAASGPRREAEIQARLVGYEARARQDDARIDTLEARVAAFERTVDHLVDLYRRAALDYEEARKRFEQAQRSARATAEAYDEARRRFEDAARNWKLAAAAIVVAASWDYAGYLCGTRMTTAQYRRLLRQKGVDLEGLDADHGLPRSWGGADHPLNYEMIDSGLNRSLGNDVVRKLLTHPAHVLRGAAVTAFMRLRCSPQL